jgi:hypothetical protein
VPRFFDRRRAGRGTDARVVEGDDPVGPGERVDQRRIPVVQVAAEVLEQEKRDGSFMPAGVPVRVADAFAAWTVLFGSAEYGVTWVIFMRVLL